MWTPAQLIQKSSNLPSNQVSGFKTTIVPSRDWTVAYLYVHEAYLVVEVFSGNPGFKPPSVDFIK